MSNNRKQPKVLIAEDDALVRRSTAGYLTNQGYEVLESVDGAGALRKLREWRPDILLTDLRMPGLDGLELIKASLTENINVPVIIISGMGTMHDAIEALRLGAFDYIIKPVQDMGLIHHSLQKALRHTELVEIEKGSRQELEKLVQQRTTELLQQNKQLEQEMAERRAQEQMVLRAKQEWERTVDAMPEMIAIIDKDHHIVRMNKPMRSRIGLPYQQILGKPCYFLLHDQERPHVNCPHVQTMQDGRSHTEEIYEQSMDRYLEVTTVPYTDADGTLQGSVHIAKDISEQKKAEKEKEKLQSQLLHAQKLESVGQLAAGIAHEINTPTQFIGTNIDFMEEAAEDLTACIKQIQQIADKAPSVIKDKIYDALGDADWAFLSEELPLAISQSRDGVKRVSSIVRAMKEFSHPGNKDKEAHNLNRIIDTTVTVARNEWKYVAEVELDLDQQLPNIPLLVDEMGQVILNMLVNAAHAIGNKLGENPEGEKGIIAVVTRKTDDWVELRIHDTGIGIPERIKSRIFDPFYTTKEVGKGTGQGLTIAHDVVDKHDGVIKVESELGEGTTFIIQLPIEESIDDEEGLRRLE